MYKLKIVFRDGRKLDQTFNEKQLREFFGRLKKGKERIRPFKWAKVITPSGVEKDMTNAFSEYVR